MVIFGVSDCVRKYAVLCEDVANGLGRNENVLFRVCEGEVEVIGRPPLVECLLSSGLELF